jgi:hypothetical protein
MAVNDVTVQGRSRCGRLVAIAAMAAVSGCSQGERSYIAGRLLLKDGTPLVGARITARADKSGQWATGASDAEGRFELSAGDGSEGIPPGEYYVTIVENRGGMEGARPATIHEKYASPAASGIAVSLKNGESAELELTLDPPS